jgi:hypothetical protein
MRHGPADTSLQARSASLEVALVLTADQQAAIGGLYGNHFATTRHVHKPLSAVDVVLFALGSVRRPKACPTSRLV